MMNLKAAMAAAVLGMGMAATGWGQAAAPATKPKPLMRDFIGINGHTVQFNPKLYAPICRLVRDYHQFPWQIIDGDSSKLRPFPVAQHIDWKDDSGKFRDWHGPVDWHEMYASWQAEGFEVDACVIWSGYGPDKWTNLPVDAYNYGKAFAEYFGPSHHNLVTSVEIGNEPAGNKLYSGEQYEQVFEAMARGVRDGDPKLTILTATTEAGKNDGWSVPIDIFKDHADLYDVINIHKYALKTKWPAWERTYPENPNVDYREEIQKNIDWRDANAPGKAVWITEFGFDASSKEPEEANKEWKDCTDLQQAQWIVRSFLMFSEMDLGRAYLYFFNDSDTPSFHASSGVTRNMTPKPSYYAMGQLYRSLGDYRFARAVEKREEELYVFEYVHGTEPGRRVWVAWSPTGTERKVQREMKLPGRLVQAERMATAEGEAVEMKLGQDEAGVVTVEVGESPVYLWVEDL